MASTINMPKLSDTMTHGKLLKWHKKIGDKVEMGEVVAEIETDKATMEMEAFDEGTIHELYVNEGDQVEVGGKMLLLLEDGDSPDDIEKTSAAKPAEDKSKEPTATAKKQLATTTPAAENKPQSPGKRVKASPLAKKIAIEKGIDISKVSGTGPGGRIVADDVRNASPSSTSSAPATTSSIASPIIATPAEGDERIELSGMRTVIADRLLASKTQTPHFYLFVEIDAAPMVSLRKQLNQAHEEDPAKNKFTLNDIIIKAAALAAQKVPAVNSSWAGDHIIRRAGTHVAVAVAIPDGLITPVVRDTDKLSLLEISQQIKKLAGKARDGKLQPDEYSGGTFTVSNLGAYGIDHFSAIINPPQAMILSISAVVKKPVVLDDDSIAVGHRLTIGLSGDHRVVDGAVGAEYLAALRKIIENPTLMLI